MSSLRIANLVACLLVIGMSSSTGWAQSEPAIESKNAIKVLRPDKTSYAHRVIEVVWEVDQSIEKSTPLSSVNIVLLSTRNGETIETTLLSQTANDGRELVSIPTGVDQNLRIRVSLVDNSRMGVSPNEFKVESTGRSIFIVRHAEKLSGSDPSLTELGQRRAKKLAAILKPMGMTHVYSTNYKRTLETATPTAEENQLEIQKYGKLDQLKQWIDKTPADAKILIVGHSNTVGSTSELFGGKPVELGEADYDHLVGICLQSEASQFNLFKFDPEPSANTKDETPVPSDTLGKKGR